MNLTCLAMKFHNSDQTTLTVYHRLIFKHDRVSTYTLFLFRFAKIKSTSFLEQQFIRRVSNKNSRKSIVFSHNVFNLEKRPIFWTHFDIFIYFCRLCYRSMCGWYHFYSCWRSSSSSKFAQLYQSCGRFCVSWEYFSLFTLDPRI